jgi:hypothetical protein
MGCTSDGSSRRYGRQKVAILADMAGMRLFATFICVVVVLDQAFAGTVPIPRPRPTAAASPETRQAADPDKATPASECQRRLKAVAVAVGLPPVTGPGECAADDIVQVEAILLPGKVQVAVTPPAMLRCSLAEVIVKWVREDMAPQVRNLKGSLKTLDNYASYDCRGRNNIPGATISEHGKANALDIRSVQLTNGTVIKLTDQQVSRDFREAVRRSACARFATVLGPGSDGYHEDHIHVDLAERRSGQHLCHWDVRDPERADVAAKNPVPLPRPRPAHGS